MSFSQEAWARIAPVYDVIVEHAFNWELAAGTLSAERFRFYMLQDAAYLVAFSRALAIAAARAPDTDAMVQFATSAREAIVVERALHEGFFRQYGISPEVAESTEQSPTCFSYANFLVATAYHAPYQVLVAALLPCFWIYWEVGKHIMDRATPDNPYQAWIDTYADEAFGAAVQAIIAITDKAAAETSEPTRADMLAAFTHAAQLEWMFWDSAYRQESWPVA